MKHVELYFFSDLGLLPQTRPWNWWVKMKFIFAIFNFSIFSHFHHSLFSIFSRQVQSWPDKPALGEENWPGDFFKSKLSFQIQHGVFR